MAKPNRSRPEVAFLAVVKAGALYRVVEGYAPIEDTTPVGPPQATRARAQRLLEAELNKRALGRLIEEGKAAVRRAHA